jgi:hypothetical protein
MLLIIALSVLIGSEWFIFKDYYPMKERSPVLCILMIVVMAVQLLIYPLAYTYNYFTRNWGEFKYIYRTFFYAFDGCLYFIYLLRSVRLVYAHEIDSSRSKTWIFQFFRHEYNQVLLVLGMMLVKVVPVLVAESREEDLFLTYIDVNFYTFSDANNSKELGFGIKQTIHEFVWLSLMVYCVWLQTLVHRAYSMRTELLTVLGVGFAFNLASIGLYWSQVGQRSMVLSICQLLPEYPLLQLMRDVNVAALFVVSIVFPIFRKRIYHMMLPIGRQHDIVKTMRDFLMTPEFIDIFAAFLQHFDRTHDSFECTDTLENWKQLMVIKYRLTNKLAHNHQRFLETVKGVVSSIENNPLRAAHMHILTHLKKSIISLEECEQSSSSQERLRLLEGIGEQIEELEVAFLEKLDQIYKSEFRQTKSYYYLKMYLIRNQRININMITMGMAVMVENEDTL